MAINNEQLAFHSSRNFRSSGYSFVVFLEANKGHDVYFPVSCCGAVVMAFVPRLIKWHLYIKGSRA